MVQTYILGIYTAKIMLFYFFMVFAFGGLIWSSYLFFEASGSGRRRSKRQAAMIWMIFFGVVLFFMGIIAILRQTELGNWFDQFLQ
jgi:hypothetical protein